MFGIAGDVVEEIFQKEINKLKEENKRLNTEIAPLLERLARYEIVEKAAKELNERLREENALLKAEALALQGNLWHTIPDGIDLPVVAKNVLAEFLQKENARLREALEKIPLELSDTFQRLDGTNHCIAEAIKIARAALGVRTSHENASHYIYNEEKSEIDVHLNDGTVVAGIRIPRVEEKE